MECAAEVSPEHIHATNALDRSVVHLRSLCALVIGCYALTALSNLFESGMYVEGGPWGYRDELFLWALAVASSVKGTLAGALTWARTTHQATQVASMILSILSTLELLAYVVGLILRRSYDMCNDHPYFDDEPANCAAGVVGPSVISLLLMALNICFIVVLCKVIRSPSQARMMGQPRESGVHTLPMGQAPDANNIKPPPGAPPGGRYTLEKHCGLITWLVGIFLFPFVCCCPCDTREMYVAPDNSRWTMHGAHVEGGECC